jgi:hypothetical protein
LYNHESITWDELSPLLNFICDELPACIQAWNLERSKPKANLPVKKEPFYRRLGGYEAKKKPTSPQADEKQIGLDKLHFRLEALEKARRAVTLVVDSKKNQRGPTNLGILLQHSRNCRSSDSRDRIYAFLGLAHEEYGIVPNYSQENTIVHVLIETAKRIILKEDSLEILRHVNAGRTELGAFLPSWVPDWMSPETQAFQTHFMKWITETPFNAGSDKKAKVSFREDESNASNVDLKVKGIFVDVLDSIIKEWPHHTQFRSKKGLMVSTLKTAHLGDQLWILYGASYAVILHEEQHLEYSFLGEAVAMPGGPEDELRRRVEENELVPYDADVMYGGLIKKADRGEVKTREIFIV